MTKGQRRPAPIAGTTTTPSVVVPSGERRVLHLFLRLAPPSHLSPSFRLKSPSHLLLSLLTTNTYVNHHRKNRDAVNHRHRRHHHRRVRRKRAPQHRHHRRPSSFHHRRRSPWKPTTVELQRKPPLAALTFGVASFTTIIHHPFSFPSVFPPILLLLPFSFIFPCAAKPFPTSPAVNHANFTLFPFSICAALMRENK